MRRVMSGMIEFLSVLFFDPPFLCRMAAAPPESYLMSFRRDQVLKAKFAIFHLNDGVYPDRLALTDWTVRLLGITRERHNNPPFG